MRPLDQAKRPVSGLATLITWLVTAAGGFVLVSALGMGGS